MAALSALRSIIGGGTRKQVIATTIMILALALEVYPANMPCLSGDLAAGMLHFIQRIGAKGLPITMR
jgi:hypothetical protein